jgi:hypothetical protein
VPRALPRCCRAHCQCSTPGLSEIAAKALKEREALARVRDLVTPDTREDGEDGEDDEDDEEGLVLFSTPPRPAGESQSGTTMTLAHRPSPE